MPSLSSFAQQLASIIGRPTTLRPFVCDGSPYECRVFIVGFNPATDSEADFWSFWDDERGFDKNVWYKNYLKDRRERPLMPGKTRRNAVSSTRRVMNWIEEEAHSVRFLETNIYSVATEESKHLAKPHRTTDAFDFLLSELAPEAVIAHGNDAVAHLRSHIESRRLLALPHLSRKWSECRARELGQQIENRHGNGYPPRREQRSEFARAPHADTSCFRESNLVKPVLRVASDPGDPLLKDLVACITSINCTEHFTDHIGMIQTDQALVVQRFREAVSASLASAFPKMRWSQEHLPTPGSKDAVDIFGTTGEAVVVIELDKNRADQVAKKFVSRSAIFKDKKIYYISLCYPGTDRMSVGECVKYFGYCAHLSKRLGNLYAGFVIQQT